MYVNIFSVCSEDDVRRQKLRVVPVGCLCHWKESF